MLARCVRKVNRTHGPWVESAVNGFALKSCEAFLYISLSFLLALLNVHTLEISVRQISGLRQERLDLLAASSNRHTLSGKS